ncbi:MAG: cysteine peptidase family C39 domain-containing protein, partial [Burkholderiales bacterium]
MMIEAALRSIKRTLSALGLPLRDVRVPTRLQFQTTECGVAALNMVLSHHGLYLSNEEVRAVTGVSRDCVNAGEMARAARHYGMECKAYSREPDNLSDLPLPFLAHFRFIHFMVVEGFTAKDVLLCDPHAGRMRIPIEKFAEDFTGVVLSIKPGPNFIRSGADTHPVRSLLGRLGAPCKTHLIAALGLAMIAALLIPAWALLLGGWAGSLVETTGDWPLGLDAARFAPLALSVALLYCAISALAGHFTAKLQAGITLGQGELLARHFMALPASFFVYRLPSKLHEVIYSCEVVARSVCNEISPRLARLLALPACLIAMAWLNPLAALAVATLALMCLSGMEAVYQFRGDGSRRANLESGEQLNSLLFGREELEQSKLGGRDREFVISRLGSQTGQQKVIQEAGEAEALQSAIATAFAMGSLAIVLY